MRGFKTFLMLCLIAIAAVPAFAQGGQRTRSADRSRCGTCPLSQTAFSIQPLDTAEIDHLLYMREEEKLARDVYQALYATWNVRIFSNIAISEQRHFDAIGTLISRYKLSDPALEAAGKFTNPDLQALYDELIARGGLSLLDALQVGVTIEETDIDDLTLAIAETDNRDILAVYGNLLDGSSNHLSAFNSHIDVISAN